MNVSRFFVFTSLILVLLTAACAAEEGATPTLVGTTLPGESDLTATSFETETTETAETATGDGTVIAEGTATADGSPTVAVTDTAATAAGSPTAGTTQTPGIPVTGSDIVLVECQFCVDTWAHALLVLPDTATFEIVSPAPATTTSTTADTTPNCSTVEVNNGRQIVLCSGPETTPLTLNVCTDVNTCTDVPIDLMACPLDQQPATGSGAVPGQTEPAGTEDAAATTTSTPGVVISTATP
ncbi:MAG TPA: hypothetical protein VHO49_09040 [Anaerolineales bacterium]|nr:hypothetical protein [Anaerolineales bacterium]